MLKNEQNIITGLIIGCVMLVGIVRALSLIKSWFRQFLGYNVLSGNNVLSGYNVKTGRAPSLQQPQQMQRRINEKISVVRKFRTTTQHGAIAGKTQNIETNFYNLGLIISLGYRIKSHIATQFRIWATKNLLNIFNSGELIENSTFSILENVGSVYHIGEMRHAPSLQQPQQTQGRIKEKISTIANFATTTTNGETYHNLPIIINKKLTIK